MTVERIELRKILSQMLADEGINRETLKDLVNEVLEEKLENAISQKIEEKDIDWKIQNRIESYTRMSSDRLFKEAMTDYIKRNYNGMQITVKVE